MHMSDAEPGALIARIYFSNKWENGMSRNSTTASKAIITLIVALAASAALASQGPGVPPGTASAFTQTTMAIIVYGSAALIIAAGFIRGLRRR
jgi:hypothetical protein